MIAEIAQRFDGEIIAAEHVTLQDWPDQQQLDELLPGELWVAIDMAAMAHPRSEWIEHRHGRRPIYAPDYTSIDQTPHGWALRTYRQLDRDWYAWLYQATQRLRARIETTKSAAWQQRAAQFNALWSVARRWWSGYMPALHLPAYVGDGYAPPMANNATRERYMRLVSRRPRTPMVSAGTPAGADPRVLPRPEAERA